VIPFALQIVPELQWCGGTWVIARVRNHLVPEDEEPLARGLCPALPWDSCLGVTYLAIQDYGIWESRRTTHVKANTAVIARRPQVKSRQAEDLHDLNNRLFGKAGQL
jgi:hypothetical protein